MNKNLLSTIVYYNLLVPNQTVVNSKGKKLRSLVLKLKVLRESTYQVHYNAAYDDACAQILFCCSAELCTRKVYVF